MEELRRKWEREKAEMGAALQRSERGASALKEQLAALQRQLEATTQKADARCRTLELEQAEKLGLAEAVRKEAQQQAEVLFIYLYVSIARSELRTNKQTNPYNLVSAPHTPTKYQPTDERANSPLSAPSTRSARPLPCETASRRISTTSSPAVSRPRPSKTSQ